jgi:hypothetical protein
MFPQVGGLHHRYQRLAARIDSSVVSVLPVARPVRIASTTADQDFRRLARHTWPRSACCILNLAADSVGSAAVGRFLARIRFLAATNDGIAKKSNLAKAIVRLAIVSRRNIVGARLMRSHWLAPRDDGEDQIAVRTSTNPVSRGQASC